MPPMYLIANPPNMLPTSVLTGVNATGQQDVNSTSLETRSDLGEVRKRSAAGKVRMEGWAYVGFLMGGIPLVLAASSVL